MNVRSIWETLVFGLENSTVGYFRLVVSAEKEKQFRLIRNISKYKCRDDVFRVKFPNAQISYLKYESSVTIVLYTTRSWNV